MNWKMKAMAFRVLAAAPFGHAAYNAAQRRVTRNAFQTITPSLLRLHQYHVNRFRLVAPGRALEFGGGRDLLSPLLLSNAGAQEILVYDIDRHSRPEQVNHCIRQLRAMQPGEWPEVADCDADLLKKYRIRYCAPGDARSTGLAAGSIKFVMSTSTLEHIPAEDIRRIHAECLRITAPGAIFSHVVDYKDHYYYSDPRIGMFNFYRYSTAQWRLWNPPNHYQNRLRHDAMKRLLVVPGTSVMELIDAVADEKELDGIPMAAEFRDLPVQDLLTQSAHIVLRRE
jgi:hypothetical protein